MQLARLLVVSLFSLLSLSSFAQSYRIEVSSHLTSDFADGFDWVSFDIHIDGKPAGAMRLTPKKPEARLELQLDKPTHHYRISGEGVDSDGKHIVVTGGGLVANENYVDSLLINKKDGAEVLVGYQTLLRHLTEAPMADLSEFKIHMGSKASVESIHAAEKRLKLQLPEDYKTFVQAVGSLSLGSEKDKAAVYGPDELLSVVDYYSKKIALSDEQRMQIAKHFPLSTQDILLSYFYLDDYSVLQAKHRCPKGQYGFVFPGYDITLLTNANWIDTNPYMAQTDYHNDIMGKAQCTNFTRVLGSGLKEFVISNADHFFLMAVGSQNKKSRDKKGAEQVSVTIDFNRIVGNQTLLQFQKVTLD